jgi:capsular exopolysaccharide synthesis family protein
MSKDFSTVSTVLEDFISEKNARTTIGPRLSIKRLVWVQGPLVLIIAAVLAVPALLAGWFLTPVKYTASADIRFLASTPRVLSSEGQRDQSTPYDKFLNTQISIITGNAVLSRVLDEPSVRSLPGLAKVEDPLEYLKNQVSCRVQRNSELVSVTCSMSDAQSAKRALEEIVKVYMDYALGAEASAGGDRLSVLTKERDARQLELDSRLRQMSELQGNIGVPLTGASGAETLDTRESDIYRQGLLKAEEELSKAQAQLSDSENLVAQIKGLQDKLRSAPDKPIFECGVEDRVNQDSRVSAMRQDLVRSEANVASISQRQREDSPLRKEEEKRLASTHASVSQLERQVRREVLDGLRAQYEQQQSMLTKSVEEARQRADKLRQQLTDYETRVQKASDQLAELADLRQKSEETRTLLDEVRREISQINLESKAAARVQVAAPASVPGGGPNKLPRLIAMAVGLCAAFGVGGSFGLLRELLDQHIHSPEDLGRITRLPVIATLPHCSEDKSLASTPFETVTADHPNCAASEEFRRVLAKLLYPEDCSVEVKTLVVASPTRGDGKTSLSCNLALAMAEASRRVLLVDLSARRPSIEKCFHLDPSEGLAELLHGDCSPEQVVQLTDFDNLCVIGPGIDAEDLAGRLASREMLRFMEWAEGEFDHVIMDTPPALLMSDVKLLAPLVDGVVVVIGVGVSSIGMVRRCLRELEVVGANMVGVVLNGLRNTRGGYLKHNLELYKAYGTESGVARPTRPSRDVRDIEIVDDEPEIALLPVDSEDGGDMPGGKREDV